MLFWGVMSGYGGADRVALTPTQDGMTSGFVRHL